MSADNRDKAGKGGKSSSPADNQTSGQTAAASATVASGAGGVSSVEAPPDAGEVIAFIADWVAKNPAYRNELKQVAAGAPAAGQSVASGPKRAICLGGGGPVLGLHIGALDRLKDMKFDVWALSCIGAWVGIVYNQATEGREVEETYKFFEGVFRDEQSYQSFPMNTIFSPDWATITKALLKFLVTPDNYRNAVLPEEILRSYQYTLSRVVARLKSGDHFSEGDFNRWTFNHILAIHPAVRFLTAMLYKTEVNGRARLFYKDSTFLNNINFSRLDEKGKPYIFHNAFNFKGNTVQQFANDAPPHGRKGRKAITAQSLCACSALPFIEETVNVDGEDYCEGALVDTLNFYDLLKDHRDVKEIWVNRIVDVRQIRRPLNQHDALANLCQMFAATVGADDFKLFKYHVRENNRLAEKLGAAHDHENNPTWEGIIVDIPVDDQVTFEWALPNLVKGRSRGYQAADAAYKLYEKYKNKDKKDGVLVIPDDLTDHEIASADLTDDQLRTVLGSRRTEAQIGAAVGARKPTPEQVDAILAHVGLTREDIQKVKGLP